MPSEADLSAHVTRLFRYPVKSCRRVEMSASDVVPNGLVADREYMVVDADGVFVSQRTVPALALVDPAEVLARAEPGERRLKVRVHRWRGEGIDQGDSAATYLSEACGEPVRLVHFPDDLIRETVVGGGTTAFADGYPLLVASERSLAELNRALGGDYAVERFRPNIVLGGLDEPWVEDEFDHLMIGSLRIDVTTLCGRCPVTTVDQDTGEVGTEPLSWLREHRQLPRLDRGTMAVFGINAIPRGSGRISVGDPVTIVRSGTPYLERARAAADGARRPADRGARRPPSIGGS